MVGKYKDLVLRNFSGGLNTKFEASDLDVNESPDLQNVAYDGRNSFGPRRGTTVFKSSAAGDGIKDTPSFRDRKGTWHVLKTTVSAVRYLNTYTSAFEILKDGFTPGYNFGFAYYGSATLDDFGYFCNGIDQMWAWHPRYLVVSGATSASDTVLYLSTSNALSALGWLSAGSFVMNGEEGYYASLSGNALSAITRVSNAANQATFAPIAQLPISANYRFTYDGVANTYSLSGHPRGNILKVVANRLHVAGVSTAGEVDFYSKIDNPWDFSYATTLSAGDGGAFSFSEGSGQVVGFGAKDNTLVVFKNNAVRGLQFNDDDIPVPLTVIDGVGLGAITAKSIVPVESDIFFASPIGAIRSLVKRDNEQGFSLNSVAQKIQPTLQTLNMASAAAVYYDQKWLLAAATSGASQNNVVLVYDFIYGSWSKWTGINANDFFIYEDGLYYGSSNENATYALFQGFDDNGAGYETYQYTKKLDYELPHELKRLRYVYIEGSITTNSEIRVDLFYNEEQSPITKTISGSGGYVNITGEAEEIGSSTFGLGTYGGQDSDETYLLYKFRVRLSYDNVDFFNMQMKFSSDEAGSVWKISKVVPYVTDINGKKFPTDNVI